MSSIFDDIFNAEQTSTVYVNQGKDVHTPKYATVHCDDHEAVAVVRPDIKRGPWIAGGACLRWYQGDPVGESDIDVFCASAKQAADVIDHIKSYGRYTVKFESENAVTLSYSKKDDFMKHWTIQIITRRYFSSLEEVIGNFDISVCEVGTCGNEWKLGPNTARDIREQNLRFNQPLQPDALKRLIKYWTYGYRPVQGTIEAVQTNPVGKWKFDAETEDYQNAF